jgi:hypothetical protein
MRRLHSTDTARNCSRDDRIAAFAAAARKHDRRIWPESAYAPARSEYRIGGATTFWPSPPMDSMVED